MFNFILQSTESSDTATAQHLKDVQDEYEGMQDKKKKLKRDALPVKSQQHGRELPKIKRASDEHDYHDKTPS
ncbi:MAG: hypothetical protein IIV92_05785 [Schwartzia sp.]|nr:hypothetical protein [Schwartzia sp. (in: firmicutes)]